MFLNFLLTPNNNIFRTIKMNVSHIVNFRKNGLNKFLVLKSKLEFRPYLKF